MPAEREAIQLAGMRFLGMEYLNTEFQKSDAASRQQVAEPAQFDTLHDCYRRQIPQIYQDNKTIIDQNDSQSRSRFPCAYKRKEKAVQYRHKDAPMRSIDKKRNAERQSHGKREVLCRNRQPCRNRRQDKHNAVGKAIQLYHCSQHDQTCQNSARDPSDFLRVILLLRNDIRTVQREKGAPKIAGQIKNRAAYQ